MDINANVAQCMVTKSHFGYDSVMNICNGSVINIDWAFMDWFYILLISGVFAFMLISFFVLLIKD